MKFCTVTGCSAVVASGRCPAHKIRRPKGRSWERMRLVILRRDPICTVCHEAPATEVDHVVSLASGGHPTAQSNLRGLCTACNRRLGLEERRGA